jgi:hypothetical protein
MKRVSVILMCGAIVAWEASLVVGAAALYEIAPVGTATETQGRAITADGKYVVGFGDTMGFFWDAVNGSRVIIDTGNTQAKELVGIGYRTYNGNQEIVAVGTSTAGPYPSYYITIEADAAAGTEIWGPKLRRTNDSRTFPVSNGLAGSSLQADAWYDTFTHTNGVQFWVEKGAGAPDLLNIISDQKSTTEEAKMQGVSSTGLAVGWRKVNTVPRNYVSYFVSGGGNVGGQKWINGLRANAGGGENRNGQLWAVSANSTLTDNVAGGYSPVDGGRAGLWPFIVTDFNADVDDTGTPVELPTIDDSIAGFATNGIVYGLSTDGRYAVGMDYTLGYELAVLWDTVLGVELNLTQYATDNGIIGDFGGNLRRAYSVGVNAADEIVVTGWGYDDVDAGVRGFVLVVPDIISALPCNVPFADDNGDTDVDQADFAAFQKCLTAAGQPVLEGCVCFDRNDVALTGNPDGSVTVDDFADFFNCTTGPDVPFDAENPPVNCIPGDGTLP